MGKLDSILADINKKYGEGTLLPAGEAKSLVVDRIPSNIFDLDMKIGGGFPRGRISMIKGEYSTGKSAICLKTAASAQKHCRFCGAQFEYVDLLGEVHEFDCKCGKREPMKVVWLDAEGTFDTGWAEKWGVDKKNTYLIQTEYAEQAIDVSEACIRSQECDLLVVDSVAALTPSKEIEASAEEWQMGLFARLMNKAMRTWTSAMNSYGMTNSQKCTIILINQMRVNLGGFKPMPTSPGGKGLDFFQSLEVRLKRTGTIEDKATKRPLGIEVEFVPKKNKTAPLTPGGKFNLYFVSDKDGYKIGDTDNDVQVLRAAAYWNLVERSSKAWYSFPGDRKVHGDAKAAALLRQDPELLRELESRVRDRELSWANELQDLSGKDEV